MSDIEKMNNPEEDIQETENPEEEDDIQQEKDDDDDEEQEVDDVEDDDDDDDDDDIDEDIDEEAPIEKIQSKSKRSSTKNLISAEESTAIIGDGQQFNDEDDILESDEDDEYSEDIFKKLESNFSDDITFVHPQTVQVNNNELKNLIKVVRNKYKIVVDSLHRTEPCMSKYEYTKILGQRVAQLNQGYTSYITREGHIDNKSIAEEEIRRKLLPVIVRRPLWSGASEYWMLQDLEILIR